MLIPRANSTAAATCITNTNAAADAAATARSRRRRSARAPRRRKRAVALAGLTVLFALREFRSAARTAANHPFFVPETAPSVATLLQRHGHHHHRDDDDSNNNNNNNETIIIDRDEPRAVATAPATGNYNKTNNNNSNTVLNYGERRAAMTATATTTTTTTNATESAAATISSSKMQQQSLRKEVVQPRDGDGGGGETFQKGAGRFRIKGADGSGSILPPAAVAPSRLAVPFGAAALASGGTPLAAGQLHRWQSSRGIDLRGLLHFVNESNAGDLLGSETPYLKNQGPFPAFIVHTAKGGVQLWISLSAIERRRKSSLALRLKKIHRFFNQALQDIAPSATDTDTTNTAHTAHTAHTANTNITTAVGNDYPALSRVMRTAGILPLALQLDDYIKCPKDNHRVENGGKPITVPLFTLCSSLDCPNSLAVPTYSMLDYTMGYDSPEEWARQFRNWSAAYPWEDKVPKLYWRGSCTYYRNIYKFNSIRARILRLSTREEVRELVDIHPTQPDNCPERGPGGNVTLASRSEPEESMKHRAVLDMDGNSWSERFPRLLCFNSAVVKMEPGYADYLWTTVKPWVHYVPATAEDFDRVARFVASDENQDALKRIVGNANAWCARRMRRSAMKRDLLTIVDGYVRELDRHDPAWLDWWSENYRSYTNEGKRDFFSTFRLNAKRMALEARDLDPTPMRNTNPPPRAVRRENAR